MESIGKRIAILLVCSAFLSCASLDSDPASATQTPGDPEVHGPGVKVTGLVNEGAYFAKFYTPTGIIPALFPSADTGSRPASLHAAYVGSAGSPQASRANAGLPAVARGDVNDEGRLSIAFPEPAPGELFPLPAEWKVETAGVRFVQLQLWGDMNKPLRDGETDLVYCLQPTAVALEPGKDQYVDFGLVLYFDGDCVIDCVYADDKGSISFRDVSVTRGWNLVRYAETWTKNPATGKWSCDRTYTAFPAGAKASWMFPGWGS